MKKPKLKKYYVTVELTLTLTGTDPADARIHAWKVLKDIAKNYQITDVTQKK